MYIGVKILSVITKWVPSPPLHFIKKIFLGVGALKPTYSPPIQKLGCIDRLSNHRGAPSNWVH